MNGSHALTALLLGAALSAPALAAPPAERGNHQAPHGMHRAGEMKADADKRAAEEKAEAEARAAEARQKGADKRAEGEARGAEARSEGEAKAAEARARGADKVPPGMAKKDAHPSTGKGSEQGQESRQPEQKRWWKFWN